MFPHNINFYKPNNKIDTMKKQDEETEQLGGLPENAYRELKEGETYRPVMSPNKVYPEVTLW